MSERPLNQFQLLTTRRFLPLFLTQFFGAFNDNLFRFALIIFITFTLAEQSGVASHLLVPLSGGVFILPFFLFSSLAGQIADKYEKSIIVERLKLTEMAIMAIGALGFWLQNAELLFIVLFLMGVQSTFFGPLKYGILPQHLPRTELTGGNGMIQMGTYTAIIIGVIAGGLLASIKGYGPWPIMIAVIGIAFLGWLCARAIPDAAPSDPNLHVNPNIAIATYRLLAYLGTQKELLVLVLTISWFWFVGATFLSMVPTYGKEYLNANEHIVTLLNAAFTVGIGIGSIICERFSRGRIELGLVPLAAVGISIFAFDFYLTGGYLGNEVSITADNFFNHPETIRAFIDLAGIGLFGAVFIIPLYAALQARADDARRSRVIAALNVTNALFMVFSAAFTIGMYELSLTIPAIFAVVGIANIFVIMLVMVVQKEFFERVCSLIKSRTT